MRPYLERVGTPGVWAQTRDAVGDKKAGEIRDAVAGFGTDSAARKWLSRDEGSSQYLEIETIEIAHGSAKSYVWCVDRWYWYPWT